MHVHIPADGHQPQTAGLVWDNTWNQEQLVPWVRLRVAESFPLADVAKLWWVEPQPAPHQQLGLDDVHMILFVPVEGHFAILVCVDWSHIEPNKHTLLAGTFASPVTQQSVIRWLRLERNDCRRVLCKFQLGGMPIDDEVLPIDADGHRLDLVLYEDSCDQLAVHGHGMQTPEIDAIVDEIGLMQTVLDLSIRDFSADLDTILRGLRRAFSTVQQTFTLQVVSGDGFVIRDVLARCELHSITDEREFRQWLEPLLSPSLRGPIRGFLGRIKLVQEAPLLIVARQG